MHRRVWKLVYEGLDSICFMCGHYGHTLDSCPTNSDTKEAASDMDTHTDIPPVVAEDVPVPVEEERPELFANHGPWMLAEKKRRGRPKGPRGAPVERTSGSVEMVSRSRFALLSEHNDQANDSPVTRTLVQPQEVVSTPVISSPPIQVQVSSPSPTNVPIVSKPSTTNVPTRAVPMASAGSTTMQPFSQPHVQSKIHQLTTPSTCSLKDSPHVTVSPSGTLPCPMILEVSSPSVPVPSLPKPPDGHELSSLRIFPPNNSTDVTMKPGPVSQTVASISEGLSCDGSPTPMELSHTKSH
ncbi:hypothetical protein Tsubulata_006633 [Turnera subulata]|uniref:CCHC-type domain-containing protein n=1 Tax=Turnera subulata TaxID=218843 RepID=A0A9Q0J5Q4_9ROSI|nr:hypothetical protein Tsubulata_006633 [Turnera subulata]